MLESPGVIVLGGSLGIRIGQVSQVVLKCTLSIQENTTQLYKETNYGCMLHGWPEKHSSNERRQTIKSLCYKILFT